LVETSDPASIQEFRSHYYNVEPRLFLEWAGLEVIQPNIKTDGLQTVLDHVTQGAGVIGYAKTNNEALLVIDYKSIEDASEDKYSLIVVNSRRVVSQVQPTDLQEEFLVARLK
jgi:hypothetical protein